MTLPQTAAILDALDATWPALAVHDCGPFRLREGGGGGKRVSSATTTQADVTEAEIDAAIALHESLGQVPLFRIHAGNEALDQRLAARGFKVLDVTDLRCAPLAGIEGPARMRAFAHWPPLALSREIWEETGTSPARQAVMERVTGPVTCIIGRAGSDADRAAGVAFAAVAGKIGMVHALVVLDNLRRRGSANNIMRQAAVWAQDHGAEWLALAVTQQNAGAAHLYASLNMPVVGQYHYRSA